MKEELIKWQGQKNVLFFDEDFSKEDDKEYIENYMQLSISGFGYR